MTPSRHPPTPDHIHPSCRRQLQGTRFWENTHWPCPHGSGLTVSFWPLFEELFPRTSLKHGSTPGFIFLHTDSALLVSETYVKHQKLVSLITVRKGFKNSGVYASEQRLYQLVPVTASWKKKMLLIKKLYTWFLKDTYHARIHFIYKGFRPQTRNYALLEIPSRPRGARVTLKGWTRKLQSPTRYSFGSSVVTPQSLVTALINAASVSSQGLCPHGKRFPDVFPLPQRQE